MRRSLFILLCCVGIAGCKQLAPFGQAAGAADGGSPHDGADAAHDDAAHDDAAHDDAAHDDAAHDDAAHDDAGINPVGDLSVFDARPMTPGQICSEDEWCWEHPLPQGNDLRGVWRGGDAVYAVGAAGTVLRYDGTRWAGDTGVVDGHLNAVWASASADQAWAVGTEGTILRVEGTSYMPETSGTDAELHGIWGDGSGTLHAVGAAGTLLIRQNGSWQAALRSGDAQTTVDLIDLWATSATDLLAVGGATTVLRYDGSEWGAITPPTNVDPLTAVCGTSDGQIFVTEIASSVGVIEHFDGSTWQQPTQTPGVIQDLWCHSPSEIYGVALGEGLLRFDGTSWSRDATGPANNLALWSGAGGQRWVVGQRGRIYEGVATGWQSHWSDLGSRITAISGSSATDVWAVLGGGGLARRDAAGWTADTYHFPSAARALWALSPRSLFAAGESGMTARWDGADWQIDNPLISTHLLALFSPDGQTVFAAGYKGALLRFDGSNWTSFTTPSGSNGQVLQSLWGTSAADLYVGADKGTLYHFNGTALKEFYSGPPTTDSIDAIWGTGSSDFYLSSASGEMLHWAGTGWLLESTVDSLIVSALEGRSATEIYAVGGQGGIIRRDAGGWVAERSGAAAGLTHLEVLPDAIFVTGGDGIIISKHEL